ncbi:MAG TPA: magnesium transporter [Candidatus Mcinerneyibacteriales bacterium]|nr:magnesium transporter [Candidatus Mcinerneyibacteriales bacterium]
MDTPDKINHFLSSILQEKTPEETAALLLREFRVEDIAEIFDQLDDDQVMRLYTRFSPEVKGELLTFAGPGLIPVLISVLDDNYSDEEIAEILSDVNDDDVTDILLEFPKEKRESILDYFSSQDRRDIKNLIVYPEDSAGGIMTTDFFSVRDTLNVRDVKQQLKNTEDIESLLYIYILDQHNRLEGVCSLHDILLAFDEEKIAQVMTTEVIHVNCFEDQEAVAKVVEKYDLFAVPVTDDKMHLLGIITADDIIDVIREEHTEDLYKTVGTVEDELYTKNVFRVARLRLPWLITTFFGSMLSAAILSAFNRTLQEIIILTSFVPVITAMGGNIGSQTATIVVRGLAVGYINIGKLKSTVMREIGVASVMGLVVGLIVSAIAILWHGQPLLGLILGLSMISAILVASLIGSFAPFLFEKMSIDPAIAAGPLVTTANDATGIVIYLGLATLLLQWLH